MDAIRARMRESAIADEEKALDQLVVYKHCLFRMFRLQKSNTWEEDSLPNYLGVGQ